MADRLRGDRVESLVERLVAHSGPRTDRLLPRRVVASGPEMQVHAAALPLDLVELALAVVLTAGLEGEHVCVPREALELGEQLSNRHALSVSDANTLREGLAFAGLNC
jgi:hypothetical protein